MRQLPLTWGQHVSADVPGRLSTRLVSYFLDELCVVHSLFDDCDMHPMHLIYPIRLP